MLTNALKMTKKALNSLRNALKLNNCVKNGGKKL